MDSFGTYMVPALCAGLAVLGYRMYRQKEDNDTTLQVTPNSSGTDQTTSQKTIPTSGETVETPADNKNAEDRSGHQGGEVPDSSLSIDGGGPSLEGNVNNNSFPNKSCTRQISTQTETETRVEVPKLSPAAMEKIHDVEHKFFRGLDQKANLSDDELGILGGLIMENNSSRSYKFLDILLTMREQGYFSVMRYKDTVIGMLQKAEIVPKSSVLEHLEWLDENVGIIISEDLQKNPKNKFEYDIVAVFADDDHPKAVKFCECIERELESLDVRIASFSDINGNTTELRGLENAFQYGLYVFLLVSSNFKDDDLKRYIGETSLIECLQRPKAKGRLVPVWLERDIKKFENCPHELKPMKGIHFYHIIENKNKYSMDSVWKHLKTLIEKGRREKEPVQ